MSSILLGSKKIKNTWSIRVREKLKNSDKKFMFLSCPFSFQTAKGYLNKFSFNDTRCSHKQTFLNDIACFIVDKEVDSLYFSLGEIVEIKSNCSSWLHAVKWVSSLDIEKEIQKRALYRNIRRRSISQWWAHVSKPYTVYEYILWSAFIYGL